MISCQNRITYNYVQTCGAECGSPLPKGVKPADACKCPCHVQPPELPRKEKAA